MKIHFLFSLLLSSILFSLTACHSVKISRDKKITYWDESFKNDQRLNVFAPKDKDGLAPVLLFIHGGKWNSGRKGQYDFFGRKFARKGVVTVIIDYPLSPDANYKDMAVSAAHAVQWTKENIEQYGGDPERIFVSGHSAGGHLAALISTDTRYLDSLGMQNVIKGAIMIDAGGLDMYGFLKEKQFEEGHTYLETFTNDPQEWKNATPLYHLHEDMPPMLFYMGEKTYPSIIKSHKSFMKAYTTYVPDPNYHVQEGKRHIPMITQFIWTSNPLYDQIIEFMETKKPER